MKFKEKQHHLSVLLHQKLLPLITADYYLVDLPYYSNIGDTLIWQGELELLRSCPHKCLGHYSSLTNKMRSISSKSIILFQGGGEILATCIGSTLAI